MSEPEQRKDSQLESTGSDHDGDGGGSEDSSSTRRADIDILLRMLEEFEADDSMDSMLGRLYCRQHLMKLGIDRWPRICFEDDDEEESESDNAVVVHHQPWCIFHQIWCVSDSGSSSSTTTTTTTSATAPEAGHYDSEGTEDYNSPDTPEELELPTHVSRMHRLLELPTQPRE